jgi:Predicted acetyltransferase
MPFVLTGLDEVLTATGNHPLARSMLRYRRVDPRGWSSRGAVVWVAGDERAPRSGRSTVALGPVKPVVDLLGQVAHLLPDGGELSMPRDAVDLLPAPIRLAHQTRWDFRWTLTPPPAVPGEDRVRILTPEDFPHAADLLDRANPTASARPGSPSVHRWVAVPDGADATGRLLAVAADTSHRGTGHTSAVATDPDARGRGLGAAVTAYLAREQVADFGLATLGFYADNDVARRLYDRLGYDHALAITSGPVHRATVVGSD